MDGVTEFQERIYVLLKQVPAGQVVTYKELARAAGCGSPRAVGQALKNNPFAPEVPCHRVIKSDYTIGGFCGEVRGSKIQQKKQLLRQEGVCFKAGKVRDMRQVFHFPISGEQAR